MLSRLVLIWFCWLIDKVITGFLVLSVTILVCEVKYKSAWFSNSLLPHPCCWLETCSSGVWNFLFGFHINKLLMLYEMVVWFTEPKCNQQNPTALIMVGLVDQTYVMVCYAILYLLWTDDGTLYSFGGDYYGCLAQEEEQVLSPTPVTQIQDTVSQVSAGDSHVVALTACGKVLTWGCGEFGKILLRDSLCV